MTSFLLERGLKTLSVRMEKHAFNSEKLAAFLSIHPKVKKVYHPSLNDYKYRYIDQYCKKGYAGMVSFEVTGGDEAALRFLNYLKIPVVATSLGGVESLVSLPFNTSHSLLTSKQKEDVGIFPGLVRLSVGIENIEDLISDLDQALQKI
jgi:cystathionine beta-lyase/cystathionine gamma-synthase